MNVWVHSSHSFVSADCSISRVIRDRRGASGGDCAAAEGRHDLHNREVTQQSHLAFGCPRRRFPLHLGRPAHLHKAILLGSGRARSGLLRPAPPDRANFLVSRSLLSTRQRARAAYFIALWPSRSSAICSSAGARGQVCCIVAGRVTRTKHACSSRSISLKFGRLGHPHKAILFAGGRARPHFCELWLARPVARGDVARQSALGSLCECHFSDAPAAPAPAPDFSPTPILSLLPFAPAPSPSLFWNIFRARDVATLSGSVATLADSPRLETGVVLQTVDGPLRSGPPDPHRARPRVLATRVSCD